MPETMGMRLFLFRFKYYYIMRVLVFTGIRISELAFLTVEVLSLGKFVVGNKGKTREVYLPAKLVVELKDYCKMEEIENGVIFKDPTDVSCIRSFLFS